MTPSRGRYVCLEGRRTSLLVTNHPLNALLRAPAHQACAYLRVLRARWSRSVWCRMIVNFSQNIASKSLKISHPIF